MNANINACTYKINLYFILETFIEIINKNTNR